MASPWKGIRCKHCGALLGDEKTIRTSGGKIVSKGKCPVNKKDCRSTSK